MKRLLLDVDGVVADFIELYLGLANTTLNRTYTRADAEKGWRVDKSLGLTRKEKDMVESKLSDPGRALELQVLPGAVDAVRELSTLVDIYFVTSPWYSSPTWMHDRSNWLKEHFGSVGKQVIHTKHKHVCVGDYFVDDKIENVNKWAAHHEDKMSILWGQPWNMSTHNSAELYRSCCDVSGWAELMKLVKR